MIALRPGSRLVSNTVLNLFGQVIPLIAGIVCLPYIIRGFGPDRFGILSLAWVLVGYFSLFDLGLGRATTKFVAEARSRGEDERISTVVWTSLATQAVIGAAGAVLLAAAAPVLASKILKLPPDLSGEMKTVLYVLSASIPVVICSRNLRGVLEAAQRFDLINTIRIPLGVLTFVVPMAGALLHYRVSAIVLWLVVLVAASAAAYLAFCVRLFPVLAKAVSVDGHMIRRLLVFGGWVTVSNIVIPVLIYLDRLFIGALVSVKALTYYTAPYEVASRLLIFPAALSTTLFPAFSALSVLSPQELTQLYIRSLKYIVLGLGPIAFLGVAFASDVLRVWLGADFATQSSLVFKILSIGMLLNALSQMPANLFDSVGRPDLRAKLFLSYVFVYAGLLWLLISRFGIVGAALAWALRGALECTLFFSVSARLLHIQSHVLLENGLPHAIMAYGGLVLLMSTTLLFTSRVVMHGGLVLLWLLLFAGYAWRRVLDDRERVSLSLR